MALRVVVKIAWLETQTGVGYATLRRHYGEWMPTEGDSELGLQPRRRDYLGLKGPNCPPQEWVVGDNFPKSLVLPRVLKWSQGDSNPCYRRERPAS